MGIGSRIRQARINKGMTQQELGELVGVQKSAIAKYESGRVVNIKHETMVKMAEALGITIHEIYGDGSMRYEIAQDFNLDDIEAQDGFMSLTPAQQKLIKELIKEFVAMKQEME